ncbi:hypothetical protein [Pediococcus pentosaceus]|uniref:hypothetical protein n=1 Tax=Pediococcus pentosaceus TaxID=1255 RepID=UPI00223B078F|nr:hypothetical protein [Pediococcus pentosaceus]MCS8573011.1 hypothetical protein [Pediococcus pentosaceus]
MDELNRYNHNEHADPHPQYNHFWEIGSQPAPDEEHTWIEVFTKKMQHNSSNLPDGQRDSLKRIALDMNVKDGISEGELDTSELHLSVYVTNHADSTLPDNGYCRVGLGLKERYRDLSKEPYIDPKNPTHIFKLFVKDMGDKDADGIPVYQVTLCAKVQSYYARVSIQPLTFEMYAGGAKEKMDITTNDAVNDWERVRALLGHVYTNDFMTESEMLAQHKGETVYSSLKPTLVDEVEQIYRNENGTEIKLDPFTTLLTLAVNESKANYNVNTIVPTLYQSATGHLLTIVSWGGITLVNAGVFGGKISDNSFVLKSGADTKPTVGTVLQFMRYNKYWVEV